MCLYVDGRRCTLSCHRALQTSNDTLWDVFYSEEGSASGTEEQAFRGVAAGWLLLTKSIPGDAAREHGESIFELAAM